MSPAFDVDVTLRDATMGDSAAVVGLDAEATGLKKTAYWRDMFERYVALGRDNRFFLVAEAQGRIVGFIVGETRVWEFGSPPSGWVFAVNVAGDRREHGIGSRLMAAICERFRGLGVDTVRTMISRDDPLNLAFFRSQGMTAGPYIELEKSL